jgi:chorismate-pyruvate lyase
MRNIPLLLVLGLWGVFAQPAPLTWPETYTGRLEALAVLQSFNAEVLASRSATAVLEAWCRDHQLASPPVIVAKRIKAEAVSPLPEQLRRLQVASAAELKYRRVELRCGERTLSEADNWYVPARLTAEMNRVLETTDRPFGRVVQELGPTRQTIGARLLWRPLPEGWESGAAPLAGNGTLAIPGALLEHRAVLFTREGKPFSEVREVYQRGLLKFAPPSRR